MRALRLFAAACLAVALYAQNPVVSGRVTDATEAAVPGAKVELTSQGTGITATTTSNSEGYYVFPSQPPGRYTLTVGAQGFTTVRRPDVALEVGQPRTVNVQLAVGQLQETISVTAEAPMLMVNQSDRGTVVENTFVKSIPLNTRNPLLLLTLTPGVTGTASSGSNSSSQSSTNNFRINGGRGSTNEVLIDGAANTTPYNNQVSSIPQVDAVQEFKVFTSPYAAEFGRTGGGVVSFAIKSGTNKPHGTLHEFLRNSQLDANGWNANRAGTPRQSFKRNQYGFTLGAPVVLPKVYDGHNRTFFFAAYEGLRERSAARFTGTVPTDLERRGDFSRSFQSNGALYRIFDPRSTRPDPTAPAGVIRYIRDQFPGNVLPAGMLSPIGQNIIKFYPAPNQPGRGLSNTDNFFGMGAKQLNMDRTDFRVDHLISSRHSVFARYNWFRNFSQEPNYYGNIATPVQTGNTIPGVNWMGSHTWTINPTTILEHHFSFNRTASSRVPETLGYDYTALGFPKRFGEGQRVTYFPLITVSGYAGVGPTGSGYNDSRARNHQYRATVTFLRGRHTIKTGFDWRRYLVALDIARPLSISTGGFTSGPNPDSPTPGTGLGVADLLSGVANVTYNYRPLERHRHYYYAGFVQDEIRLTPRLTLIPGLRYSLETPTVEDNNQYVYLDLDSPSPIAGKVPGFPNLKGGLGFVGINGLGRRTQLADTNNFDPRLGVTYRFNDKTVARGGMGIFHHPSVAWTDIAQGFQRETRSLTRQPDGYTTIFNLADPFPFGIQMPTGNTLGLSTLLGQKIVGPLRRQHVPYQVQWSIDVQRQLPMAIVLDLGYTGSSGVGLPSGYDDQSSGDNLNQLPMEYLALRTQLTQQVPNPFYGIITDPTTTLSNPTVQRGQLLRPYPQFLDIIAQQTPIGHSTYHAMQMRVERRFANGFALLFSWTHSKIIDNAGEIGNFLGRTPGVNNRYCYSCDRSLSFQHVPDVVRTSYRYELPFGVGKKYFNRGIAARVIGGWAVAGFLSWDNGLATYVTSSNLSGSFGGGRGMRPNATGQPAALPGGAGMVEGGRYFNAAAFTQTQQFEFGNVSRTLPDVRDPGNKNWDALLEKRIAVNERVGLDFRVEMFNAVNGVVYGGPSTNINQPADFGLIRLRQVNTPRQMQFGLRLSF